MENICNVVMPARDVLITILAFVVGFYVALVLDKWADYKQRKAIERVLLDERLKSLTGG